MSDRKTTQDAAPACRCGKPTVNASGVCAWCLDKELLVAGDDVPEHRRRAWARRRQRQRSADVEGASEP